MCLIVVAYQVHPEYSTVIASNRDEFTQRESKGLHVWENEEVVGGKDMQGGGTWLGMNRYSPERWAAITNYRGIKKKQKEEGDSNYQSRGTIITNYLSSSSHSNPPLTAMEFITKLQQQQQQEEDSITNNNTNTNLCYNGFHLLVGDTTGIYYYGNQDCNSKQQQQQQPLPPGIYGLSNDGLDTPWPKVLRSKHLLSSILEESTTKCCIKLHKDILKRLLYDRQRPEKDEELPQTGIPLQYERYLSSIFIDGNPTYGTRSSTTILLQPPNENTTTTTTVQTPHCHVSIMETIWPSQQSTLLQYNHLNGAWSSNSFSQS